MSGPLGDLEELIVGLGLEAEEASRRLKGVFEGLEEVIGLMSRWD